MKRLAWWVLGAVAIAAILGAAVIVVMRRQQADAAKFLADEVAAARREGLPLSRAELLAKYPLPPGQDAAPVYRRVMPRFKLIEGLNDEHYLSIGKLLEGKANQADIQLVRLRVGDVDPQISEVIAASKLPRCDLGPDEGEPGRPGLALDLVEVTKYLAAKAELLTRDGKIAQACDVLAAIGRIGQQIRQGGTLMDELCATLDDGIGLGPLRDVLAKSSGNPALIVKCQAALDTFGPDLDIKRVRLVDAVTSLQEISELRTTGDLQAATMPASPAALSQRGKGLPLSQWIKDEIAAKLIAAYRKLSRAFASATNDPTSLAAAARGVQADVERDRSSTNGFARIYISSATRWPITLTRNEYSLQAERNLARMAVRLMQDHLRTGRYPASLAGYGTIAVDPRAGKPFSYRLIGSGFDLGSWSFR
ncbi:MAG TPA: hypothetical protein VMI31_00580 [Fimbriimonadaceae bacterium]|nr:hypothetical protein [Fimbriimonadaceae bacterium]